MRMKLVRERGRRSLPEAVLSHRAERAVAVARFVAAIGAAASILLSEVSTPSARLVAYVITLYTGSRLLVIKPAKTLCVVDAILASFAIALTGATGSPMLAFGVVVAAAGGFAGVGAGAICGNLIIAASVPALARQAGGGMAGLNHAATWAALFPLAGIAAGFATRVWNMGPANSKTAANAEDERHRIARDLHDGVAQTLAHLRMELDMLSHPSFAETRDPEGMARLARVAERTLTDVRGMIRDLATPAPIGGVAAALSAYVGDVSTHHGPSIAFSVIGDIPADHPGGTELFRIAQEAISNAVRHAHATRIEVLLEHRAGNAVRLRVSDNGVGTIVERAGGLGLTAMRERAGTIRADYAFTSEPGRGTVIEVVTPPALMRIA
ncbi:MAG: hypothetical protein NVSMB57_14110 [Actinomycetota bacterium]